jgi:hypothetical protein
MAKYPELEKVFNQPPLTAAQVLPGGGNAVPAFREEFKTPGLDNVVSRSKARLTCPEFARASATVAELRKRVATLPVGTLEAIVAQANLVESEKLKEDLHCRCQGAARGEWNTAATFAALRDDLRELETALELHLQRIFDEFVSLHLKFGWDAPSKLYLMLACVPYAEINDFLENQLRPMAAQFSVAAKARAEGTDLPMDFDVLSAPWFLRGKSWRSLIEL